jgi:phage baseplate assembly protein gpV
MDIFDAIRELQEQVADAHAEIAKLKSDHDHTVIHGPVTDVDAQKQLCRIQIGVDENGDAVKSPWRPYGQIAGTRKVHSAPSKGQQLTLFSPGGDVMQGVALRFTWSDDNPSPSQDGSEDVDLRGKSKTTQRDGSIKQEVEGATLQLGKQSKTLTIHKDEQNVAQVDDAHPWQGNQGDALHRFEATKEGGFVHTVKIGDHEHKVTIHPDNGIEHSVDGGAHVITVHPSNGIKHKSSVKVSIEAARIEHLGDVKVSGSILAAKTIQSAIGLKGPVVNGSPFGDVGDAANW